MSLLMQRPYMLATPPHELLATFLQAIEPGYYRLGTFFVVQILDDPAMLAFAFS